MKIAIFGLPARSIFGGIYFWGCPDRGKIEAHRGGLDPGPPARGGGGNLNGFEVQSPRRHLRRRLAGRFAPRGRGYFQGNSLEIGRGGRLRVLVGIGIIFLMNKYFF